MKTLIVNVPEVYELIHTQDITDEVQIIVDTRDKMFECCVNLYELELAWFGKDPREVPFDIRQDQEWKRDAGFLKQMVLNNLELVEEIEP